MADDNGSVREGLYPELEPFAVHSLDVGDGHTLYVEEAGAPDGLPVVFLHGGPGSGCSPMHRRYFDPEVYRVVLFDQRGAGRSTPRGELSANTTPHLIADMERLRAHLAIDRWMVFGGSWGATLGLLYAQAHPERVTGLVLRGSFLGRRRDLDWFTSPDGVRRIFPDAWRTFEDAVPGGSGSVMERARRAMESADTALRQTVALAWEQYAAAVALQSLPDEDVKQPPDRSPEALAREAAGAGIELYYSSRGFFIRDNQILEEMDRIAHLPAVIVHGRRDLVCPAESGFTLAEAFSNAELHIVRDAGHLGSEAGIIDGLVRAARTMQARIAS